MKKKAAVFVFGLWMLSAAAVCAEDQTQEEQAQTSETDSWYVPAPKTGITRGNTERETPDENGMVHSYLTGELVSEETAYTRPLAIMLNNIISAVPQSGIASAGVVYEAPVEGAITRLLGIFEDYSDLEKIGSVRSCRDYYVDFAMEFDAVYVHYGQTGYAYYLLDSEMLDSISGLQYQDGYGELKGYAGEDAFYRTDDRPAPHNVYTSYERLQKALEKNDINMSYDDDYTGHFKFAADGETVTYSEGTATHIEPDSGFSNKPWFEYDAENGAYKRFQYGDAQTDELTGEQLTYENVIIQYCDIAPYDDNGYLNINTNSGGKAMVFTQGTYQTATWEKESDWGPTRYYDADGNEITINQGKTWVTIADKDTAVTTVS